MESSISISRKQTCPLLERDAKGQEIIIAKAGNPVAKLTAYPRIAGQRKPGIWKGKVVLADDFDTLPRGVP